MRAGHLTQAHVGKMCSTTDRSGILRGVGRKVRLDDVWITMHVEVIDGTSVLFLREQDEVLVES